MPGVSPAPFLGAGGGWCIPPPTPPRSHGCSWLQDRESSARLTPLPHPTPGFWQRQEGEGHEGAGSCISRVGDAARPPGGGRWGTTDRCVMYTHMHSHRHAPVHTWPCMAPCESSHTSFCAWFLTQLRACGPCACRAGVNSRGAPPAWQGVGTAGGAQAMPPSANSCPSRPQFWHC